MKISKWEFEKELDALITAAQSTSCKETAKRYLMQADNKIDGYDNIPDDLKKTYRKKIYDAENDLDI